MISFSRLEDSTVHCVTKKRARDESNHDPFSPDPKISRVDSVAEYPESFYDYPVVESAGFNRADLVPNYPNSCLVHSVTESYPANPVDNCSVRVPDLVVDTNRVDSVVHEPTSPDTIVLTEEILDILEDTYIDSSIQGLDSVIKSFVEEITTPFPTTDSGQLDYLLGASDDELGLPPAKSQTNETPDDKSTESATIPFQNVELKEDFAFVDELPFYDSAEFGLGEDNYDRTEFVTLGDGLFDYSETPDYMWHPESLTAL